uniref:Alpha-tocopherol transfer protein-like n=1 Tax=Cacopsylla melanoneura TaxID=428564 RepID=A0A8D8WR97_9HEMI
MAVAELHKCTPTQFETFRAELNEFDEEKIHENEKKIHDWYSTQPHLPQNYDKRIIRKFIRGCKHDLERVKRKLNFYFLLRAETPEFYANRNPMLPELQYVLTNWPVLPLPNLTQDGYRVTYFEAPIDKELDLPSLYKAIMMICDIRTVEEDILRGDVFVFNSENATAKLLSKLVSPLTKKAMAAAQEAYPQRLSAIHVINANVITDKVVNFFKMFVKVSMKNRFHVHSKLDSLYQHVDRSCLPSDLGGGAESIANLTAAWKAKVESYGQWYKEQESVHTDLDKVVAKEDRTTLNGESFGTEGSFRQLKID